MSSNIFKHVQLPAEVRSMEGCMEDISGNNAVHAVASASGKYGKWFSRTAV